jgi:O-antigen/teichoic acid export membrane protein
MVGLPTGIHKTAVRLRTTVGREGLFSNASLILLGEVVTRVLGFLFPLVLAGGTSKSTFALVYFFISTGFFVAELVLTGYPIALIHFLALHHSSQAVWVRSAVVGGIPLLLLSITIGEAMARSANAPPGLMSVVVIGLTIDAYYFAGLQGLRRFRLLPVYRGSANLLQLLLLLVVMRLGIISTAVAITIYSLVYLLPITVLEIRFGLIRKVLQRTGRPQWEQLKALTRFALPALVAGTAFAAVFHADSYFVQRFAPDALADYGAAKTLLRPMQLIPFALGIVLFPQVSAASPVLRWRLLRRGLAVVAAVEAAALAGCWLLAPWVIDVFFPSSYESAVTSLRLLAPASAILGCYHIMSQWWLGVGRPFVPAVSFSIGALVCIACHLAFTSRYGTTGAAVALTAGIGVATSILGTVTGRAALRRRTVATT